MPNVRGSAKNAELETAHPWPAGRFAEAEPQERRGAPGSRGLVDQDARRKLGAAGPRRGRGQEHSPSDWTGVNPLPPIDPDMPMLKPGDQAG